MLNMVLKEKDTNKYNSFPTMQNLQEINLIQFKNLILWGLISYMLSA